ncbi:hypothetical protein FGG08_001901 [Glutinoglossum americanum]|uniref:UDP-glucuronic acid decarboxylase 1 n=1 Tax=Glutinoglossum americanum TaxID=1670608 RepID=A0A9P8KZS7_9PEZI|nr:hypothetical protein FGG08_001901 [Glutinoglossum americanum]
MSKQPDMEHPFNEQFEQMGLDARARFMQNHLCNVMHELQGSTLGIDNFGENPDGSLKEHLKRSYGDWLPPYSTRMRIVVTGAAGFVGSHLVDFLMKRGHTVIAIDNFSTGYHMNLLDWMDHRNFELHTHDVRNPLNIKGKVDQIFHLAGSASPDECISDPISILTTCFQGTINMLELARRCNARFLLASSCGIYGFPLWHHNPQSENFLGNVKTFGRRACHDEGKRAAESLCYAYAKQHNVEVRIARVFNTFGPRMRIDDGRVVSTFILQCLRGECFTIKGDGNSSRSLMYISDLIDGLIELMLSDYTGGPMNFGKQEEYNMIEVTEIVTRAVKKVQGDKFRPTPTSFLPARTDDPLMRHPDCTLAKEQLGWSTKVDIDEGMLETVEWFAAMEEEDWLYDTEEEEEGKSPPDI